MKKLLLPVLGSVFLLAGLSGTAQIGLKLKQQPVDFANQYAQSITTAKLKEKLSVIASREMEGRETASPGQRKAAAYIEQHFQKLGLLPGTTGDFKCNIPFTRIHY